MIACVDFFAPLVLLIFLCAGLPFAGMELGGFAYVCIPFFLKIDTLLRRDPARYDIVSKCSCSSTRLRAILFARIRSRYGQRIHPQIGSHGIRQP